MPTDAHVCGDYDAGKYHRPTTYLHAVSYPGGGMN